MPAAAVIPAPIAYINAVAVKKLVVGFGAAGRAGRVTALVVRGRVKPVHLTSVLFTWKR